MDYNKVHSGINSFCKCFIFDKLRINQHEMEMYETLDFLTMQIIFELTIVAKNVKNIQENYISWWTILLKIL